MGNPASSTALNALACESKEILNTLLLQPESTGLYAIILAGALVAMTVLLLKMHSVSDAKNVTWGSSMLCVLFGMSVMIVSAALFKLHMLEGWERWLRSLAANSTSILYSIADPLTTLPTEAWLILAACAALAILVVPVTRALFSSNYSSSLVAWMAALFVGWIVVMGLHFAISIDQRSKQIIEDKKIKPARPEDAIY